MLTCRERFGSRQSPAGWSYVLAAMMEAPRTLTNKQTVQELARSYTENGKDEGQHATRVLKCVASVTAERLGTVGMACAALVELYASAGSAAGILSALNGLRYVSAKLDGTWHTSKHIISHLLFGSFKKLSTRHTLVLDQSICLRA